MKTSYILLSGILCALAFLNSVSATDIGTCQAIQSSGSYTLNTTLVTSSSCLTFNATNINLDLAGYSITGDGGSGDYAIILGHSNSANGAYITSGNIKNFDHMIEIDNAASNVTIIDIVMNESQDTGIHIDDTNVNGLTIDNLTMQDSENNTWAVLLSRTNADNVVINNSNFDSNNLIETQGCSIQQCTGWVIANSVIDAVKADSVSMSMTANTVNGRVIVFDGSQIIWQNNTVDWAGSGDFWFSTGASYSNWINYTNQSTDGIWINMSSKDSSLVVDNLEIITANTTEMDYNFTVVTGTPGNIKFSIAALNASTEFGVENNSYSYGALTTDAAGILPDITIALAAAIEYNLLVSLETDPIINSNATIPATPRYGLSTYITSNITDTVGTITSANFTLSSPNGTNVIDNVNGTATGDIWNSSAYTIDEYGSWNWTVNATDDSGRTAETWGNFSINLGTLSIKTQDGDSNWSISNNTGTNNTINLTFSHTGNSNNTVNFTEYGDLANSSRFSVSYSEEPSIIMHGVTKNLTATIEVNDTLTHGNYSGFIEVNRTDDSSYTNITINITVEYGVPDITDAAFTITVISSGSTTQPITINNTGNYNVSSCDLTFTTALTESNSWNITSFTVQPSTAIGALLSLTAGGVAGIDAGATMYLNCTTYTDGSYNNETITGTFTITSAGGGGSPPGNGGGGGGGGDPEAVCGNGFCEFGEDTELCPEDCQIAENPNFTFGMSPDRISVWTAADKVYTRNFDILNPNEDTITIDCYFACIENDASCEWITFVENGTSKESITFIMPVGDERLPTRRTVRMEMQTPENIPIESYRVNVICESLGLKKVLPFTLESLATLGPLGMVMSVVGDTWGANVIPFPPIWGADGIYGSHIIIVIVACFSIIIIYVLNSRRIYRIQYLNR